MWQKVLSNGRKKTAKLLQREEETPHTESAARRSAQDARAHLYRRRQGTRARFQTVQAEQNWPGARDRVFSRQGLARDTETTPPQPNPSEETTRWRVGQTGKASEPGTREPTSRLRARHREIESVQNPGREI